METRPGTEWVKTREYLFNSASCWNTFGQGKMVEQLQEEAGMFLAPPPIPQGSLQPPAALDNGPGTIESDDEVDNFSGSDSDDEVNGNVV
ncbi:hypothetical protein E2C01_101401 [Portunus trituberculatus]|uniref:Uncharacterized protein n=1 Tax=Portunus trituberculatus TaxID=210409 RepID=A0A5B7KFH3_PORTR|nr:hypothetical protein [Portunus trituberculatus]